MKAYQEIKQNIKSLQEGLHELDKGVAKMIMLNEQQISLCEQIQDLLNQLGGDKE